jgi:uncharacterized protein YkwD|tara:strand:+ start:487 stop:1026 length:540 start_codon:yes stop_codon:yes gene_type:complete
VRYIFLILGSVLALSACTPELQQLGPDGKPLPKLYNLANQDSATVQFRVLDAVNALRKSAGHSSVSLNAKLTAAAATHSRDMSLQNRPWHFGSDGSSPLDRVERVGYAQQLIGEAISETFETELETIAAWMKKPNTRNVLLDPMAREIGFSWYQESTGKIWWTLVTGGPGLNQEAVMVE